MNTASRWCSPVVVISGIDPFEAMTESRRLLQHFLGALAYRTQKALRDAPDSFADFRLTPTTRTPFELVWHMTGVIGYARTFLHGGDFEPPRLGSFAGEIARFHDTLTALSARLRRRSVAGAHHRPAVPAGAARRCHDARRPAGDAATGAWLAGAVGEFRFRRCLGGQRRSGAGAASGTGHRLAR